MAFAWLIGFCATTVGLGVGGGIAWFLRGFQRSLATIYALCGGLIAGLIGFEIAPEAIQLGDWIIFTLGVLSGVLLFELLHKAFHHKVNQGKGLFLHTGLLLIVGISLHNLPMGFIFGSTSHSMIGASILPALILHNIPEGIILFTPLFLFGIGFYHVVWISIIVAFPVAVGAFFGSVIGMDNPLVVSFFISLAIGTILMITIREILAESTRHSSMLYCLLIALMGSALIGIYFELI